MAERRRIIVVGAGASGLMAAGKAAECGAEVLLLEKMHRPARKLRITGKGRCNLTNITSIDQFLKHYGRGAHFIRPAFYQFSNEDLITFFQRLGVKVDRERGGRVFPASGDATEIVDALVKWVRNAGVRIITESPVHKLIVENDCAVGVEVLPQRSGKNAPVRKVYKADAIILSTGGASYPLTGSTGDGYRLAESVGHAIVPIRPALVPLETAGDLASELEGLKLKNVSAKMTIEGKKRAEAFGEMEFTSFGVTGPIILTLSKHFVDAILEDKEPVLVIDLKPALNHKKLDARLIRDINSSPKTHFRKLLRGLLPVKLIPVCIRMTGIPSDRIVNQITSDERKRLRKWLKEFCINVTGSRSFDEALITAGGVELRSVDPHTMCSRLVRNLYFTGEILDIDAETGGYNLQSAFSTGWVAGSSAASG